MVCIPFHHKTFLLILGEVNPGLPAFQLPWQLRESGQPFVNTSLMTYNETPEVTNPIEIMQDLGMGLILLPIISIMPQAAMAQFYAGLFPWKFRLFFNSERKLFNKFFALAPGARVDISQEILALGSSQLLGSFVGSMAVTASIGRSGKII